MHRQCIFFAREISRLRAQTCFSLCKKLRMDNDHTAHRVGEKNFLASSSHTSFCSVYQDSDGSYCVKTGLLIERHSGLKIIAVSQGLNLKSRDNLSALEPSDSSPMYIRKCRVLPCRSAASAKSNFSIVVVKDDILNSSSDSPGSYRGTDNSSCLRKSPLTTCSSDSREGRVFDTGSSFTDGGIGTNIGASSVGVCHTDFSLCVSGREQDFSTKKLPLPRK